MALVPLVLSLLMASCGEPEPLRIGFVGGLSGRVADLGIGGRNGAILAIEEFNRAGGLSGRSVELVALDDRQDEGTVVAAVEVLAAAGVKVVIGPMTSAMAVAAVPAANRLGVLLVSPTATTETLAGIDDRFVRVISTTREYAEKHANYQYRVHGIRRLAVVLDSSNAAYTEVWFGHFRDAFVALGGEVVDVHRFASSAQVDLLALAREVLTDAPDMVLVLANSLDAALLSQQLRKIAPAQKLAASEWAATERLIELGGRAVEGIVIGQFLDRDSQAPRYLAFRDVYQARFARAPGFAAVAGYDAASVVLQALAHGDGDLKPAVLSLQPFAGLQGMIPIDRYGDSHRDTHLTTVRDGRFRKLESP